MNSSDRYQYMVGIVDGLRALGGAARPSEIYAWLESQGLADAQDLATVQKDGGTRFKKEVRWARKELFDAGLIGAGASGQWFIHAGMPRLSLEEARAIVRIRSRLRRTSKTEGDRSSKHPAVVAKPTKGPSPTDWSGVVHRVGTAPASTYVARFGERDVWKVGHAQDLGARLTELNRHVPHEILGEQWHMIYSRRWSSAVLAYGMEQALLVELTRLRTTGERVACNERRIRSAWDNFVRAVADNRSIDYAR